MVLPTVMGRWVFGAIRRKDTIPGHLLAMLQEPPSKAMDMLVTGLRLCWILLLIYVVGYVVIYVEQHISEWF
jgi:hypothetical protein